MRLFNTHPTGKARQIELNQLLDVTRLAAGKLTVEPEPTSVVPLVEHVVQQAQELTDRHLINLDLDVSGPIQAQVDPLRLVQVLTNLLGNAAKFTDPGGHIRLTAEVEAGQAVLRVRDNGRGIAPDLLPRVFDLFSQIQAPAAPGTGGLGIGLALVKSLVELHGGSISACSDGPGTGSEIVVRLPVRASGS